MLRGAPDGAPASPFSVIRPIVEALLPVVVEERPDLVADHAPAVLELLPEARRLPALARARSYDDMGLVMPADSERRLHREPERVARTILGAAALVVRAASACPSLAGRPVVVVVDDLHRADRPSLLTVLRLARAATGGRPRLVVGAAEPDPGEGARAALVARVLGLLAELGAERARPSGQGVTPVVPSLDPSEAVREARRALAGSNYEALLEVAGRALETVSPDHPACRDLLMVTGLTWSFLGDDERSLRAYEKALACSSEPESRAEVEMYLALINAKRLGRLEAAEAHVERGLAQVAGRAGFAADFERGWLLNVKALVAFTRRDLREAMSLTRAAMELMRPHGAAAAALTTNLVANVSILYERSGQLDQALATWRRFLRVGQQVRPDFEKHYAYREGYLLLLLGRLTEALRRCAHGYACAAADQDHFHQEALARAACRAAAEAGDWTAAAEWAERAADLCERLLLEHAGAAECRRERAWCRERQGLDGGAGETHEPALLRIV
jgi:tetratricopeptide (TPR) repeat protein